MSEAALIALGGLAAVATVVLVAVRTLLDSHRESDRLLRRAARKAGLTEVRLRPRFSKAPRLSARAGSLEVLLDVGVVDTVNGVLAVGGLGHEPSELSFVVEDDNVRLPRALGQREVELGDEAFDDLVWLRGSPALAHALLDAETRRTVVEMIRGVFTNPGSRATTAITGTSASLSQGTLRISGPFSQLLWVLPAAVAAARRLVKPNQLVPRLARNAREDPVAGVRLSNLRVLVERYPSHWLTGSTVREAQNDPDAEVALAAATTLGAEGRLALVAIARREDAPDEVAARALTAAGEAFPAEDVEPLLTRALRRRQPATARACLVRLGAGKAVDRLAQVLAVERGDLARAAAEALAATGEAAAEPPLLEALGREDPALQLAVARALGAVGTAAAVAPMREALAAPGAPAGLGAAVREAVGRIQSRLTGAEVGQLSIAEAEGGELSLAAPGAGRKPGALSLAEPTPNQNEAAVAAPSPGGKLSQA